ncbi:hypothetical protein MycrhDRAFT_6905 [Mycolicibacterium rhodesiae JS60]|nr:hypothetical protein MycrhDRAFT_6905 [Mycolicibacterium rhodesiae JS60]
MTNTFKLDSVRAEAESRYAPTVVELSDDVTVELKSYLRLGEKDRKAAADAFDEIDGLGIEDADDEAAVEAWAELVVEACSKVFRLLTKSPKKLIAELEHEDPRIKAELYVAVLSHWMSKSQLGEAVSSPS